MLEIVRRLLRDSVALGDTPAQIDAKVRDAAPGLASERFDSMWLYGWHRAEATGGHSEVLFTDGTPGGDRGV